MHTTSTYYTLYEVFSDASPSRQMHASQEEEYGPYKTGSKKS